MWTHFWDMHSGGGLKEAVSHIFIEAPQAEAERVFFAKFGHNPGRVSCTCCGEDYSIDDGNDLAQLTAYQRGCAFDSAADSWVEKPDDKSWSPKYQTLDEYRQNPDAKFIEASEITDEERRGDLPEQGYVWVD